MARGDVEGAWSVSPVHSSPSTDNRRDAASRVASRSPGTARQWRRRRRSLPSTARPPGHPPTQGGRRAFFRCFTRLSVRARAYTTTTRRRGPRPSRRRVSRRTSVQTRTSPSSFLCGPPPPPPSILLSSRWCRRLSFIRFLSLLSLSVFLTTSLSLALFLSLSPFVRTHVRVQCARARPSVFVYGSGFIPIFFFCTLPRRNADSEPSDVRRRAAPEQ